MLSSQSQIIADLKEKGYLIKNKVIQKNEVFWGVYEIDTKRSAFHFESRRDNNFKWLQKCRWEETLNFIDKKGRLNII